MSDPMKLDSILNPVPTTATMMTPAPKQREGTESSSPLETPYTSAFSALTSNTSTTFRTSPVDYPKSSSRSESKNRAPSTLPLLPPLAFSARPPEVQSSSNHEAFRTSRSSESTGSISAGTLPAKAAMFQDVSPTTSVRDFGSSRIDNLGNLSKTALLFARQREDWKDSDVEMMDDGSETGEEVQIRVARGDVSKIHRGIKQSNDIIASKRTMFHEEETPAAFGRETTSTMKNPRKRKPSETFDDDDLQVTTHSTKRRTIASPVTSEHEEEDLDEDLQQKPSRPRRQVKSRKFPEGTECMNPSCSFRPLPGQAEENFRTCVLDHFGRNKAETVRMKQTIVWCRKCYQHASYRRDLWPLTKCELILENMYIACIDEGCLDASSDAFDARDFTAPCSSHCEVRYNITMRHSELSRLNTLHDTYDDDVQAYIDRETNDASRVLKTYTAETKKKGEEHVAILPTDEGHSRWGRSSNSFTKMPIEVLRDFYDRFAGNNKTRAECIDAVDWCRQKFEKVEIDDLPRFEFVIQCPRIKHEIQAGRSDRKPIKSVPAKRASAKSKSIKAKTKKSSEEDGEHAEEAPPMKYVERTSLFTAINHRRSVDRSDGDEDELEVDVANTYSNLSDTGTTSPTQTTTSPIQQIKITSITTSTPADS